MNRNLAVLALFGCACVSSYAEDPKSGTFVVHRVGNIDFVTTLQRVESPANRWKPGEERLPVDVTEFARRAKQHLLRRRSDIPATVNVISAEIRPFTITTVSPNDASEGALKPQRVAWYLVFTFSRDLPDGKRLEWEDCTVGMMLDGTTLEMVERRKP
jgi:hypothetical protein